MPLPSGGGLTSTDQEKVDSLPKSYLAIKSSQTYAISGDELNPTIFTTIEAEVAPVGWQVESALGGARNISGRNLVCNLGVASLHVVSSNPANRILRIYSEISTDNGSTWVKNVDSGRQEVISSNDETYGSKASQAFNVPDQAIVRFRAYANGTNVSVSPVSFTADGETVDGPSFRWWIKEA